MERLLACPYPLHIASHEELTLTRPFLIAICDAYFFASLELFILHQVQVIFPISSIIEGVRPLVSCVASKVHARNHARAVKVQCSGAKHRVDL